MTNSPHSLAQKIGRFDATMIVMGGIVGSGIFMNPSVVARIVHSPFQILLTWTVGGLIALAGGFIYAELASRRPAVGGQYAYLREGIHPLPAFLYGWTLLLVIQSGGMAAVALTFSRYFLELTHVPFPDWLIAVFSLLVLTIVNCLGVRAGTTTQSILMTMKIAVIALLVFFGLFYSGNSASQISDTTTSTGLFTTFGAAMVPVLFAYGGWQTSGFIAGEMKNAGKDLPVALLIGVSGVVLLYLLVNIACIHVLGAEGLAATKTPATAVMALALGERGSTIIAAGIAISTLGFLSQGMLTAPRVYFAMAKDGLFFKSVYWIHPKSRVPVLAIALQGALAVIITLSGTYEQILNYVVSADFLFFGLTGIALLMIRKNEPGQKSAFRVPGHPVTTVLFIAVSWWIVFNTFYKYPADSLIGLALILAGIPVYFLWSRRRSEQQ